MQYTDSKLAAAGAVWFAVAVAICFPLLISVTPGIAVFDPERVVPSVLSGVMVFGAPAALVGALLARRLASGGALAVFLLGASAVLATCLLAGPWLALWSPGSWSLARFFGDAIGTAELQLFLSLVPLRGLPLLLGGLVALGFRAMVSKWRGA